MGIKLAEEETKKYEKKAIKEITQRMLLKGNIARIAYVENILKTMRRKDV